jgi:hypothetical protein
MPAVVDELTAVDVLAHVDVGDGADADQYDVACVFWRGHGRGIYDSEQRCRHALMSAKRVLIIGFGTSDLSRIDADGLTVVFCESPFRTGGRGYDEMMWRRAVKSFVRDIQFDTRAIRRRVADVAGTFKGWLAEYKSPPPDVLPSSEHVRVILGATAALACLLTAPVVLARMFPDHGLLVSLAYVVALLLWSTVVLRWLPSFVERAVQLTRDLVRDWLRVLVLFGGSVFGIVWAGSGLFVAGWYPPAVLLAGWATLFIGAVALLVLPRLRSRGFTPDVLPSSEDVRDVLSVTVALACFLSAPAVLAGVFPDHVLLVLLAYGVVLVLGYTLVLRRLSSFVERVFRLTRDLEGDWPRGLVLISGSVFVVVWTGSVRFVAVWLPPAALLASWAALFIGAVALFVVARLPIRGFYHVSRLFPARSRACFISYPPEITAFVGLLESELARQGIAFYDGQRLLEAAGPNPGHRLKRQIRSAMRNSGFVLAFLSDASFQSEWCAFELDTAKVLGRPTLCVVLSVLSSEKAMRVPRSSLSLLRLVWEAFGIVARHDARARTSTDRELEEYLWSELHALMARVCSYCHGHGTEWRYRTRLLPSALRLQCSFCAGRGHSPRWL